MNRLEIAIEVMKSSLPADKAVACYKTKATLSYPCGSLGEEIE